MSIDNRATITALKKGEAVYEADPRFEMAWTLAPSGKACRPLLLVIHERLAGRWRTPCADTWSTK